MNEARIKRIAEDNKGKADDIRKEVIKAWFKNTVNCCWEKIIQVLCKMDMARVANEIATKYECEFPDTCGQ